MVIQNNTTPWVILALIVLCMAIAFGTILSGVPFGPSQEVKDEQARVDIRATEGVLSAIETPQAVFAGQTAIVAELTAMPPAQTATAIVVEGNLAIIQQAATQTKMAGDTYLDDLSIAATATAISRNQAREDTSGIARVGLVIVGTVVISLWIIAHAVVNVLHARAQEKFAQARLIKEQLNEQRQATEFLAAQQKTQGTIIQPSIPTSLMKQRGNGHGLPRAE
jgi:hypothetical protein